MTYTAEDTLQYVEHNQTIQGQFLRWLSRTRKEAKHAKQSYPFAEIADFLHTTLPELESLAKELNLQVKGKRLTYSQIAKVKKHIDLKPLDVLLSERIISMCPLHGKTTGNINCSKCVVKKRMEDK